MKKHTCFVMHFCCWCFIILFLFVEIVDSFRANNGIFIRYGTNLFIRNNWVIRPGEEIIHVSLEPPQSSSPPPSTPQKSSISELTLLKISQSYGFSIHYLGDFVCSLGLKPPIRIKEKIEKFLSEEQISSIFRAIMTLDSVDVNAAYNDQQTLDALAKRIDVPVKSILKYCVQEKINIPFGPYTRLHSNEMNRLHSRLRQEYPKIYLVDNPVV